MPEVDVLLKGLLGQPGVEGFLVFNDDGASPLSFASRKEMHRRRTRNANPCSS